MGRGEGARGVRAMTPVTIYEHAQVHADAGPRVEGDALAVSDGRLIPERPTQSRNARFW
jgi:hypothetical protein